jgi:hypothetical protein
MELVPITQKTTDEENYEAFSGWLDLTTLESRRVFACRIKPRDG